MNMKIMLASTLCALLAGCGSSSNSSSANNTPTNSLSEITVIDSYVIGATVCDSDGVCAKTDENGVAKARFNRSGALTSTGGFIDANLNHIVDANEVKAPTMSDINASSSVITPITDLLAHGADKNKLATLLEIPVADLYTNPIKNNNIVLAKAMQISSVLISSNSSRTTLIDKINTYTPQKKTTTALPDFGSSSELKGIKLFSNYALTAAKSTNAQNFIINVQNSDASDVQTFMNNSEKLKINKIVENTIVKTDSNTTASSSSVSPSSSVSTLSDNNNSSVSDTTTNSSTSSASTHLSPSTNSALPNFDDASNTTNTSSTSESTTSSALPNFDSNQTSGFSDTPTNSFTPPAISVTPQYDVKFFNRDVVVTKTDNDNFKFKTEQQYNLSKNDFNLTAFLDVNMTSLFSSSKYTTLAQGHHSGKILFNFRDKDIKSDVNLTANDVDYFIDVNKTLSKITLQNGKVVDLNATNTADSGSETLTTNYVTNGYYINLSKALNSTLNAKLTDLNNTFIAPDHNYTMSVIYDIHGIQKHLTGDFKVINAVAPSFTLLGTTPADILLDKSSQNMKIATASSYPLKCELNGVSGLSCSVDANKDLNITGTPSANVGLYSATITLTNEKYNLDYNKTINISIIDTVDTQLVSDWNLTNDGNFTGAKIFLDGNDSNKINVYTSATAAASLAAGSAPESNQTILIDDDNGTYRINFTFDNVYYSNNDVFKIVTDKNKSVTFRLGDFSAANNSASLK